jgi:hypothetical protein
MWISMLFFLLQALENFGIAAAFYGLFMLGAVLLFAKPKLGILYYISVCILSTDTPLINATSPLVSIHTVGIGSMALMPLWTLLLLGFLLLVLLYRGSIVFYARYDGIIALLGFLFLVAAVIGSVNISHGARIFISDASYYINTATIYVAIRLFFQREKDLRLLTSIVIVCLGVRALAGIVFYIIGIGAIAPHLVKPVMDSVRNLFPFLPLLGFAFYYLPGIKASTKTTMIIFAFGGVFNVMTYASRGNMILLMFCLLLLLFLLRRPNARTFEHLRKIKRIILPAFCFLGLTLVAMHFIRPGSLNFITWKLKSTLELGDATILSSANVRWLEFQNIVAHLWDKGSILWGEGLGGYFTDHYKPFAKNLLDGSAFKNEWIFADMLYKPHGSQLFTLLKMGILGTAFYFFLLLVFFIRG